MKQKRSRENSKFWLGKIKELFRQAPKSQLTENRWRATRCVLTGSYPWIDDINKDDFIQMLSTADYVSRQMRLLTEGQQTDIKKRLSEEAQVQLYFQ